MSWALNTVQTVLAADSPRRLWQALTSNSGTQARVHVQRGCIGEIRSWKELLPERETKWRE